MEINGVSIPRCRIEKIKNADDPLMARTLWEKIKNWFGIGQEVTVILLIKDTFLILKQLHWIK
ncbi:hypothetical protein PROPEN_03935 [Proteus penneri ATCC 35198]|nr:hypothetical protein PROPEN_03935 [Proteus penneri ATCC 35198]